mmetsp:Transcript_2325/g.5375  ORF Transcript_2325/g.5375 Transcript_2325/m.5375 type:complete len:580 (+) Transcript_2325:2510-4249(+)
MHEASNAPTLPRKPCTTVKPFKVCMILASIIVSAVVLYVGKEAENKERVFHDRESYLHPKGHQFLGSLGESGHLGGKEDRNDAESRDVGGACKDALDCELNGECVEGYCKCDAAWTGPRCSRLRVIPAKVEAGLRKQSTTTWGGNVLRDVKADGQEEFHMFVSEIVNRCGLKTWRHNSRIVRATSKGNIVGPYEVQEEVVPVWAHNPQAVRTNDDRVLLFHIGDGTGIAQAQNCLASVPKGTSPCGVVKVPEVQNRSGMWNMRTAPLDQFSDRDESGLRFESWLGQGKGTSRVYTEKTRVLRKSSGKEKELDGGSSDRYAPPMEIPYSYADVFKQLKTKGSATFNFTFPVHVGESVLGPWTPMNIPIDFDVGDNANPAPLVLPNNTILILFHAIKDFALAESVSNDWRGPYKLRSIGGCGKGEDPFLYVDKRGHFHCLAHAAPFTQPTKSIVHSYSTDGYHWHTSTDAAAGSLVEFEQPYGSVLFSKRERPKLLFNKDHEITHLITGVTLTPECTPKFLYKDGHEKLPDRCLDEKAQYLLTNGNPCPGHYDRGFTLIQELGQPSSEAHVPSSDIVYSTQ